MSIRRWGLALIAVFGWVSAGVAAELVVIDSTVPRLAPGQVVDSTKPLNLAPGARLSLVGEDGKVIRLQGPYAGLPVSGADAGPQNNGVVRALSRLFSPNHPQDSTWGTFRGAETLRGDEAVNPPDVWALNVLRSETACLPPGGGPVLWRPHAETQLEVILLHLSTGREATVTFSPGETTAAWPAEVPILDGGVYVIRDVPNQWERRLLVRLIPLDRGNAVEQAAWMSDMGCIRQAKALVSQLSS
ncbi:MAG: hypothetical protein U1E42_15505 [Rhodospirillales bacterium]